MTADISTIRSLLKRVSYTQFPHTWPAHVSAWRGVTSPWRGHDLCPIWLRFYNKLVDGTMPSSLKKQSWDRIAMCGTLFILATDPQFRLLHFKQYCKDRPMYMRVTWSGSKLLRATRGSLMYPKKSLSNPANNECCSLPTGFAYVTGGTQKGYVSSWTPNHMPRGLSQGLIEKSKSWPR